MDINGDLPHEQSSPQTLVRKAKETVFWYCHVLQKEKNYRKFSATINITHFGCKVVVCIYTHFSRSQVEKIEYNIANDFDLAHMEMTFAHRVHF